MYEKFGGDAVARLMEQRWYGHYKNTLKMNKIIYLNINKTKHIAP